MVLFIALSAGGFVAVPLVASIVAAVLGGWALRKSAHTFSNRSALLAVMLNTTLTAAFVLVASQRDGPIPVSRPDRVPETPAIVLAGIAGSNVALCLFVATQILRRMTSRRRPPPIVKPVPASLD